MQQQKKNIAPRSLLLLGLLTLGLLVCAAGGTLARYLHIHKGALDFTVRPQEQVYLGQMVQVGETPAAFDSSAVGQWVTDNGAATLGFTVANGPNADAPSLRWQEATIRLVGSLGVWDAAADSQTLTLQQVGAEQVTQLRPAEDAGAGETDPDAPTQEETDPDAPAQEGTDAPAAQTEGDTPETTDPAQGEAAPPPVYTATATRIQPGTALYTTYGDGWLFAFYDQDGNELSWELAGGAFSTLHFVVTLQGAAAQNLGTLQLQVSGKTV